jgi:hypothetical protein
LVLAKDGDGISVQKLMVVLISATKYPLKVDTCPRCHIYMLHQRHVIAIFKEKLQKNKRSHPLGWFGGGRTAPMGHIICE